MQEGQGILPDLQSVHIYGMEISCSQHALRWPSSKILQGAPYLYIVGKHLKILLLHVHEECEGQEIHSLTFPDFNLSRKMRNLWPVMMYGADAPKVSASYASNDILSKYNAHRDKVKKQSRYLLLLSYCKQLDGARHRG